ncbi:unnamed protein product [Cyclocybe aegerita]|uniref:Uncharacterized protein n=1 Tax=Cyclocybe aegerita TaxID=1973307 RepID=A0A8S0XGN5_CYCAE|nr:unnamed protein product [Cyclocybe aegerita]
MPADLVSIAALATNLGSLTADILSLKFLTKSEDVRETFSKIRGDLTTITDTLEANIAILDRKDAQRFKRDAKDLLEDHRHPYDRNEKRRVEATGRRRKELKESIRQQLKAIRESTDGLLSDVLDASNLAKLKQLSDLHNLSAVALSLISMDITEDPFDG